MFSEFILSYERSNLIDENLIKLSEYMGFSIDEEFINEKIFFGRDGKYINEDYGSGKVFLFRRKNSDECMLVNTYLFPSDQFAIMEIGVRCKEENKQIIKSMLKDCFEDENLRPIGDKLIEYRNDTLFSISKQAKVTLAMFYEGKGARNEIELEKVMCG